jgi:hypothetical protein
MMRLKILAAATMLGLLMSLLAIPVKAEVGIAVGVYGNFSTFDTSGTEREGNDSNAVSTTETESTSISEDVDFGSIFLEVVGREGMAGLTFGIEHIPGESSLGAKVRTDTDTGEASGEADTGDYTAKAEISDHVTFYLEPTLHVNDNFGLYVKGGLSRVTVHSLESLAIGTDSSTYGNEDVWGTMMGFGIRATSSRGIFLKLEYTETDYDTVTLCLSR